MPDGLWARGPQWAQMGGWVAPTQAAQAAAPAPRQGEGEREREITPPLVILHFALLLSLSLSLFQLTLWMRTSGHLYAWLCMSSRSWMRASTCVLCMHRARNSSGWVSRLRTRPHKCTEGNKYVLWFTVYVKKLQVLQVLKYTAVRLLLGTRAASRCAWITTVFLCPLTPAVHGRARAKQAQKKSFADR